MNFEKKNCNFSIILKIVYYSFFGNKATKKASSSKGATGSLQGNTNFAMDSDPVNTRKTKRTITKKSDRAEQQSLNEALTRRSSSRNKAKVEKYAK